MNRRDVNKT
uniref:Uncharacterized protein n=1 Tax=Anguilla anguilla TaxID=7936 RepID=A0A0E9XMF5_ANGAN